MDLQRRVVKSLRTVRCDVAEGKVQLAVKVVRDRLRAATFTSRPADKFGVFRSGDFGLDVRQAGQANKLLADLHKQIDAICPIANVADV
jgi:hypothetical protein